MEANIVVKAEDLTPDFADGICKVFSKSAMLHIKIEYNLNSEPAPAGKKRGPKPKGSVATATTGKKRGRKSAAEKQEAALPKKRGPKPKVAL